MFDEIQIQSMAAAVARTVNPLYVVLFGSYARGDMHDGSDIDLLIVEREDFDERHPRREELSRIRRALQPFKGAKDILVFSRVEMLRFSDSVNHVLGKAFREGKILYEG